VQGLRRRAATGKPVHRKGRKGKAPALWADEVRKIARALPDTGAGVRDKALLLVGFLGALRRSDLSGLQWWQVEWHAEGVLLHLQASKTDKTYTGQTVALNSEPHAFCPVAALAAWRAWCINHTGTPVGELQQGAVFRSLNKHQQAGSSLSAHAVGQIIKARAAEAGVAGVTAHSLRRGHISEAHKQGRAEADIMHTSRHKSVAVFRGYIAEADPFGRATGKGLL
jgi:integrase